MAPRTRDPKRTRRRILEAAYKEFYRNGFQGGSINAIVRHAGITKGALFHHFSGKDALAHAVIDEFLVPAVQRWWVEPLARADDPIAAIQDVFRRFRKRIEQESPASGYVYNGCPICNYATEMSPLDEEFRQRLHQLYSDWRTAIATALEEGQFRGSVRKDVRPADEAAFLVATIAGTASTGKAAQKLSLFQHVFRATDRYLESLRA